MVRKVFLFIFVIFSGSVIAENSTIKGKMEVLRPYFTPIDVQTNKVASKAQEQVKKALNGDDFYIPKNWRLVNVVNKPVGNGYIMFFQDSFGNVFSLGIDQTGHLTGSDMIFLEAKPD